MPSGPELNTYEKSTRRKWVKFIGSPDCNCFVHRMVSGSFIASHFLILHIAIRIVVEVGMAFLWRMFIRTHKKGSPKSCSSSKKDGMHVYKFSLTSVRSFRMFR